MNSSDEEQIQNKLIHELAALPDNVSAVALVEQLWHKKYSKSLLPILIELKKLAAFSKGIETEETKSDGSHVDQQTLAEQSKVFQLELRSQSEKVLRFFSSLINKVFEPFSQARTLDPALELRLKSIYARYYVIQGDMQRYLEKYACDESNGDNSPLASFTIDGAEDDKTTSLATRSIKFSKCRSLYIQALNVCPEDGKAYSGLYIVTSASSAPFLSFIYLVKSMTVKLPVRDQLNFISDFVNNCLGDEDSLTDVPFGARAGVARCMQLVVYYLKQVPGNSPICESVEKQIMNVTPVMSEDEDFWATLVLLLLGVVLEFGNGEKLATNTPLEKVFKMYIGRSMSLGNLPALAVAVAFVQRWGEGVNASVGNAIIDKIKLEFLNTLVSPRMNAKLASKPLYVVDHLVDFPESVRNIEAETKGGSGGPNSSTLSVEYMNDVAGSRLCLMLDVPFGSEPLVGGRSNNTTSQSCTKAVIIIDAANVACKAGEASKTAKVEGIIAAYQYWVNKGHSVKVFVSEKHASRSVDTRSKPDRPKVTSGGIKINLNDVYSQLPHTSIVSIPAQNHDDSYMIHYALQVDGLIVSNDMFRDWASGRKQDHLAKRWAATHVIGYTFADDMFMPNPDFVIPPPWDTKDLSIE